MGERIISLVKVIYLWSVRLILPYLPFKVLTAVGNFSGDVMIGSKAGIMKDNLSILFGRMPDHKSDAIIRQTMKNSRKDLLEIWTFPKLSQKRINQMAYFEGLENLDRALAKKKGVLLCVTHFGSWKMVLPALGYNGYAVTQVAANPLEFVKHEENYYHNKVMKLELRSEESVPANFIYVEPGKSVRPIFRALAENRAVVIALDGIVGANRVQLPFLNGNIMMSGGAVRLALSTRAELLPIFIVRQADERHKIVIHEPFEIDAARDRLDKDRYASQWLERYAALFETYVREHPDHYTRYLYTVKKYPVPGVGDIINNGKTP